MLGNFAQSSMVSVPRKQHIRPVSFFRHPRVEALHIASLKRKGLCTDALVPQVTVPSTSPCLLETRAVVGEQPGQHTDAEGQTL